MISFRFGSDNGGCGGVSSLQSTKGMYGNLGGKKGERRGKVCKSLMFGKCDSYSDTKPQNRARNKINFRRLSNSGENKMSNLKFANTTTKSQPLPC